MNTLLTTIQVSLVIAGVIGSPLEKHLSKDFNNKLPTLKIINGQKVPITKYPFMVSIDIYNSCTQKEHILGSGVVLNENYILGTAFNAGTPYAWKIRAGSSRWHKGGRVINTTSVLVHPKYDLTHGRWKYNVALYKTQEPIKFNKKIQPVEIGTENLKVDTKGTVLGWGDKGEFADPSDVLLKAENTVLDYNQCNTTYSPDVDETNFCSLKEKAGPCASFSAGDNGDRFVVDGKVYGLYAGGLDCTQKPRVYVNLPTLADWIKKNSEL